MGWNLGGTTDGAANAAAGGFSLALAKLLTEGIAYMQGTQTQTAITASATETQAAATQLSKGFNEV